MKQATMKDVIRKMIADARKTRRPDSGSYIPIVMNPPTATYPLGIRRNGKYKLVVNISTLSLEDVNIKIVAYHTAFDVNHRATYSDPIAIPAASATQTKLVKRLRKVPFMFDIDTSALGDNELITFVATAVEDEGGPPAFATLLISP